MSNTINNAIVVIDNSQPYLFLTEDNDVTFYIHSDIAEESLKISGVHMIIIDAVVGKTLYSTEWNGNTPLPAIQVEEEGVVESSEPTASVLGPYICKVNLKTLLGSNFPSTNLGTFLAHPLILSLAIEGEGEKSAYSEGALKTIIESSSVSYYVSQGGTNNSVEVNSQILQPDNYYYFNFKYNKGDNDTDSLLSATYSLSIGEKILQTEEAYFSASTSLWSVPIKAPLLETVISQPEATTITLKFQINFTTVKGCSGTKTALYPIEDFSFNDLFDDGFQFTSLTVTPDENKGVNIIQLTLKPSEGESAPTNNLSGRIQVLRKDLTTGSGWAPIREIAATLIKDNESSVVTIEDLIVEPGKPCLYKAIFFRQFFNGTTQRWVTKYLRSTVETSTPVILMTDDIFLIRRSGILRLAYNPELTAFKRNMADQSLNTLGGAYPFVIRNGKQCHKTFTLGGLLSYNRELVQFYKAKEMVCAGDSYKGAGQPTVDATEPQVESVFTTRINFNNYLDTSLSSRDREFLYEKEFREAALDFLYDDDIILFKSLQEGNIIIRLINVSTTPNAQLSRMVYSFSGQAVEVMENSVQNCYDYFVNNKKDNIVVLYDDLYVNSVLSASETLSALNSNNSVTVEQTSATPIYLNQE